MTDVAVLGTGLIGASIGLGAGRWLGGTVRGWDPDPGALGAAAARGAVHPSASVAEAVAGADLVFVCTPVSAIAPTAIEALGASEAVVTDAGSVKARVVDAVSRDGDPATLGRFVGGHPLTGSERAGAEAASAGLLDGATWALTPGPATDAAAVAALEEAVRGMGANPVRLDADRHDAIVSVVSHLPQVASTAMMRAASRAATGEPGLMLLAAGGFRDLTRLAASSPELWADILIANRALLAPAIEAFVTEIRGIAEAIEAGDADAVRAAFHEAKEERLSLAARPQARVGVVVFGVPIPDRPGALADITRALAAHAVNIEDIEMVHTAEGARGTVHLTVAEADAPGALEALADYEPARLT